MAVVLAVMPGDLTDRNMCPTVFATFGICLQIFACDSYRVAAFWRLQQVTGAILLTLCQKIVSCFL